ncbi:hypothetical protein HYALB_00009956 [Hymenoscyphus albidus]|uniref:Bromodomain-containing protein n=1 Tax=Hymenoscyphus albidus TaxID=595503 RepID=A0A9N9M1S7_9HELO|nr:hypothetical protein HYALB_00009956 [Hymenoscyphus albidus]
MSSDAPTPSATEAASIEVKGEEKVAEESNAPTTTQDTDMNPANPPEATPSAATPAPSTQQGLTKQENEQLDGILRRLSDARDPEDPDREIALAFQRMLNKRTYPDYFRIIKDPIAFSTIRMKINKKQYKHQKEFIRDFAQVFHNAMVYNRPSSEVYQDAIALQGLLVKELEKLVGEKVITAEEAALPDLGEIPEAEPSPPRDPDEEDEEEDAEPEPEEEEEESEEDEEEDVTDDDRPRGRRKRGRRSSGANKREKRQESESKEDPESQKKRGRPPKVHTPMEARINTILKTLRKFKNDNNELKVLHFEKLPDKTVMPEYYQEIKHPIAMDTIKKRAKRKNYQSVDQVMKDLDLMFENAKSYNLEDSQVYKDAVDLQKEAKTIAEQEKQKPDEDFADEDGRLPLSEILHNGELWKVGDWIHLANPNDVTKPIVAQVYRTWQDPTGQKWINACWYYRPEQTVHRYEKHFFENEVVKTGQYRDHKIDEVVDRCFVMFFTRFNKGRPRGFPADKEVYVCEARYNEMQHKLNKIKTWASCVPDEVREKDYEMDLFDVPRSTKKVPSPIKHLLREDAKEDDPLPKPTWGAPNAPPIVGAVHRRPREANESPPPEPTPSPPPPEPEPVRRPITSERPRYDRETSLARTHSNAALPSPMTGHSPLPAQYGQQFPSAARPSHSPAPSHQMSYGAVAHSSSAHPAVTHTPHYQTSYAPQYTSGATPIAQPGFGHYGGNNAGTPVRHINPAQVPHQAHNAYNPPRPVEVYHLPEPANFSIPPEIRSQFQQDEYGRVLFFTAPPLDANPIPEEKRNLTHSLRYLADKARAKEEEEKKRKARDAELEAEANAKAKRMKADHVEGEKQVLESQLSVFEAWTKNMEQGTDDLYKQMHGDDWKQAREADLAKLAIKQQEALQKAQEVEKFHETSKKMREVKVSGFTWV